MTKSKNTAIVGDVVNGARNIWKKYPAISRIGVGAIALLIAGVNLRTVIAGVGGYCIIRGIKIALGKAR